MADGLTAAAEPKHGCQGTQVVGHRFGGSRNRLGLGVWLCARRGNRDQHGVGFVGRRSRAAQTKVSQQRLDQITAHVVTGRPGAKKQRPVVGQQQNVFQVDATVRMPGVVQGLQGCQQV